MPQLHFVVRIFSRHLIALLRFSGLLIFLLLGSRAFAFTANDGYQAQLSENFVAVNSIAVQVDGKAILGGSFTNINGEAASYLVRLNIDGSSDDSFDVGSGPNASISKIEIAEDGKIYIVGAFTQFDGMARSHIARLNSDGSLDTSFAQGLIVNAQIHTLALQDNGAVLIGGAFTHINTNVANYYARLSADGGYDTSLDSTVGADADVYAIGLTSNQSIWLGGSFNSIASIERTHLALLDETGRLDQNVDPRADGGVHSLAVKADDSILIGGEFSNIDQQAQAYLAKLNAQGELISDFDPIINNTVFDVRSLSNGEVMIGGEFSSVDSNSRDRFARLHLNGDLDDSFEFNKSLFNGTRGVRVVQEQNDGKLLIGGTFTVVDESGGTTNQHLVRVYPGGELDETFALPGGLNSRVVAMAKQADGKLIISGDFTSINGVPINKLARLNTDGTVDTSFDIGDGPDNRIEVIEVQADGKILIGGSFRNYNGVQALRLARLSTTGAIETLYRPGFNGTIRSMALQPDGKLLVGGSFSSVQNGPDQFPRNRIARVNTDGTIDADFAGSLPTTGSVQVFAIGVQSDGKVIVGGQFRRTDGQAHLARLNTDGTLDSSFCDNLCTGVSNGPSFGVFALKVLSDDTVLLGGSFLAYSGTTRNRVAKTNADGSLDTNFDPGSGANATVWGIDSSPDGKVVVIGDFTDFGGRFSLNRVVTLNADGSVPVSITVSIGPDALVRELVVNGNGDYFIGGNFENFVIGGELQRHAFVANVDEFGGLRGGFNPEAGAINGFINAIGSQKDYKTIIVGQFTEILGEARNYIARFNLDGSIDRSFNPDVNDSVGALAIQRDNKILISGEFTEVDGQTREGLARLHPDGTLDTGFVSTGLLQSSTIRVDLEGRILLLVGSSASLQLVRLLPDGSQDATFAIGFNFNDSPRAIGINQHGELFVAGFFREVFGIAQTNIAKFTQNGFLDTSFVPPVIGVNDNFLFTWDLGLMPDDSVILAGSFNVVNGESQNNIVRLDANGDIFPNYPGPSSAFRQVSILNDSLALFPRPNELTLLNDNGSIAEQFSTFAYRTRWAIVQPDGKLMIVGDGVELTGAQRPGLGRAQTEISASTEMKFISETGRPPILNLHASGMAMRYDHIKAEISQDKFSWSAIDEITTTAAGWEFPELNLEEEQFYYIRVTALDSASPNAIQYERVFEVFKRPAEICSFFVIPLVNKSTVTVCL